MMVWVDFGRKESDHLKLLTWNESVKTYEVQNHFYVLIG